MTEQTYFEQADQELEELNRKRDDFMADATPVCLEDTPKLIELGEKLRTEDTSINAYELYRTLKRVQSYSPKSRKPASC